MAEEWLEENWPINMVHLGRARLGRRKIQVKLKDKKELPIISTTPIIIVTLLSFFDNVGALIGDLE